MKRKILLSAFIIIALSILAIGGTLAYYSTADTAHNSITTGGVAIKIVEKDADGNPFPKEGIKNVMPGQSVTKEVTVENVGENDIYLRVKVTSRVIGQNQEELDDQYIDCDFDDENWQKEGEYYYYLKPLTPNTATEPLFSKVKFDEKMGNDYQKCTVYIDIDAQAVQARNNGDNVFAAAGWPAAADPVDPADPIDPAPAPEPEPEEPASAE